MTSKNLHEKNTDELILEIAKSMAKKEQEHVLKSWLPTIVSIITILGFLITIVRSYDNFHNKLENHDIEIDKLEINTARKGDLINYNNAVNNRLKNIQHNFKIEKNESFIEIHKIDYFEEVMRARGNQLSDMYSVPDNTKVNNFVLMKTLIK